MISYYMALDASLSRKALTRDNADTSFELVERRTLSKYAIPESHRRLQGRRRRAMGSAVGNEM